MVMRENEEAHVLAANFRMAESAKSRSRVTGAANQAMQNQMLSLIDTHKFSTSALARAVAQLVKIELVGIAAKASIRALYEVGLGLATSFVNPPESATHFAAASQLALIGAASLAGAAAVNVATGGGAQQGAPGSPTGEPLRTIPGPSLIGEEERQAPQLNVTLHVDGIISPDNLSRMIEEHVVPELENFTERGGEVNLKISEEAAI